MNRRDLMTLIGSAAVWPVAARGQQPAMPVIGFLNGASAWEYGPQTTAFRQGLSETGYVEGRNVLVEYRWAEGHYERLSTLAADLAHRQPAVIATGTIPATLAAKEATTTTPIVFLIGVDPVGAGFVASLNRPGGNLTGVTSLAAELGPKRVELLHELVPKASVIGVLADPVGANNEEQVADLQQAALALGLRAVILDGRDLDSAFASVARQQIGALFVVASSYFYNIPDQITLLAAQHRVAAIYESREFPEVGGLISYGVDFSDVYRQLGLYAGKILKGAKPADLPVMQPTKFELVINLKTAKALGLTVSNQMQLLADEVIE
jgi:putative tryptophan/tyrosine transport system substrate-binding protein